MGGWGNGEMGRWGDGVLGYIAWMYGCMDVLMYDCMIA
jgi:hypothetical protein